MPSRYDRCFRVMVHRGMVLFQLFDAEPALNGRFGRSNTLTG